MTRADSFVSIKKSKIWSTSFNNNNTHHCPVKMSDAHSTQSVLCLIVNEFKSTRILKIWHSQCDQSQPASPAPITPPVVMTEPLCAGPSVTAAVSCTATGLSAEPQAGATWLSEGAAVSTGINDAALFIHPATLALRTTLLRVVWVRCLARAHARPPDRLVGKSAFLPPRYTDSSIYSFCVRVTLFRRGVIWQVRLRTGTCFRVGKMSPNEAEQHQSF